jgi:hypothetical protein
MVEIDAEILATMLISTPSFIEELAGKQQPSRQAQ